MNFNPGEFPKLSLFHPHEVTWLLTYTYKIKIIWTEFWFIVARSKLKFLTIRKDHNLKDVTATCVFEGLPTLVTPMSPG